MVVKVVIPEGAQQAVVSTRDRSISMQVPVSQVARRLNGRKVGFFSATMEPGLVLEIGDILPDEAW